MQETPLSRTDLHMFSLGIVVQDKERDTDIITVSPIERFPSSDELLKDIKVEYSGSLPDRKGVSKPIDLTTTVVYEAKWLPHGHSNRETSPDVYKNETVILYRFADEDKYFWTTIMREPELRRLEHVTYLYSNEPRPLVPYNEETSYWEVWSTMDKLIHRHTSNNDGEPFRYDDVLNTKEGTWMFTDDIQNLLYLESEDHRWTLRNTDNSYVILDKEDIEIHAPDEVHIDAGEHILETAPIIVLRATNYICEHAPNIWLRGSVTIGDGECGVGDFDLSYHDYPFVHISRRLNHARIGNAWESYTHYDDQDMISITKGSIQEETPVKFTKASESITEETTAKTVTTTESITEETTVKTVAASESITENTRAKTVMAQESISEQTTTRNLKAKTSLVETEDEYNIFSEKYLHQRARYRQEFSYDHESAPGTEDNGIFFIRNDANGNEEQRVNIFEMHADMEDINASVAQIQQQVGASSGSLDPLKNTVELDHDPRIAALEEAVQFLMTRVTTLEEQVANHELRIAALEGSGP